MMTEEMKPNQALLKICEEIKNEGMKLAQELAKGAIKLDHSDAVYLTATAMQIQLLKDLLYEMRFLNHEKRMESRPLSLMNRTKDSGDAR